MSVFSKFSPRLQQAIVARLGWTALRPVQELAGEALLGGANAVVLAPTAGGKTEASIFPTLSILLENPAAGVGALYIAPIEPRWSALPSRSRCFRRSSIRSARNASSCRDTASNATHASRSPRRGLPSAVSPGS